MLSSSPTCRLALRAALLVLLAGTHERALAQPEDFTVGGVVWDGVGSALQAQQEGQQATKAISAKVHRARSAFWDCYHRRCKEKKQLGDTFAEALLEKDTYYAWMDAPTDFHMNMPVSVDTLIGSVDGGIIPQCRTKHRHWAGCFFHEVTSGREQVEALRRCEQDFNPYVECRNRLEYELRPWFVDTNRDPLDALTSWWLQKRHGLVTSDDRELNPERRANERIRVGLYARDFGEDEVRKIVKQIQGALTSPFEIDPRRAKAACPKLASERTVASPLSCFNQALANLEELPEEEKAPFKCDRGFCCKRSCADDPERWAECYPKLAYCLPRKGLDQCEYYAYKELCAPPGEASGCREGMCCRGACIADIRKWRACTDKHNSCARRASNLNLAHDGTRWANEACFNEAVSHCTPNECAVGTCCTEECVDDPSKRQECQSGLEYCAERWNSDGRQKHVCMTDTVANKCSQSTSNTRGLKTNGGQPNNASKSNASKKEKAKQWFRQLGK